MNTSNRSSACAKFILGGEHSIVTRGRAIALPLKNLRLEVEIGDSTQPQLMVNLQKRTGDELKLLQELCRRVGAKSIPSKIEIKSDIPIGSGLGSSASLSTALAKLYHPESSREEIAQLALKGEEIFHRNPSGIDPFTIALEEAIAFRSRDQSWKTVSMKGALMSDCRFLLFDSGQIHQTADVQKSVEKTKLENPLIFDDLMDAMATNAERMIDAFENAKLRELGALMKDSHFRLIQLGVSNDSINEMTDKINALPGCFGSKLTGAGCGGFILGLFESPGSDAPIDWYKRISRGHLNQNASGHSSNEPCKMFEWRAE